MTRQETLAALKQDEPFDLLVVGGGATGCGIAVDAALRGLKVALVEKNDLAEGTSSRSTKLVHGGVRYLEKAVKRLDKAQYDLVREGLHERGVLLKNAPHLSNPIPFVTPLYKWLDVPMVTIGLKLYDLLAGKMGIGHSRLLSRKKALQRFPMLQAKGLKAGVLYYDGQFNDARMAVALAMTAREHGAVVANHVEVTDLVKESGHVAGARLKDSLTGSEWTLRARGVVNATGPFGDRLRQMDDPAATPIITASSGIHIVLDERFAPPETGLMIPKTEDGRVLFVIPWQGHALVGTTDDPAEISEHPRATEDEVDYLLRHVRKYFDLSVTRDDIKATWSGLRPLVADPEAADTSNLVRDHVISMSEAGLLTIVGGKWTSYRRMAEDTVDQAVAGYGLEPALACQTNDTPVAGGAGYLPDGGARLVGAHGLAADVAANLNRAYGDRADAVAEVAAEGFDSRLHPDHPYIEAEIVYAVRHEFAERAIDVLARRLPLALIDKAATAAVARRVVEIMAKELGWDEARGQAEYDLVTERLAVAL
ncbi:FAD-dependent oxidoreductase [uncultured Desulfuromonas sp.]|uniref:glycerol-3-phosphate dehydrogenase/oxidase n=1 Tax=uncultured Desulfuromonas sp. TaxID=181013 RepID=UPI00260EB71A|nr:FAD-dependent oxidoreductase [uncultured Desulfuromonas sp.]